MWEQTSPKKKGQVANNRKTDKSIRTIILTDFELEMKIVLLNKVSLTKPTIE